MIELSHKAIKMQIFTRFSFATAILVVGFMACGYQDNTAVADDIGDEAHRYLCWFDAQVINKLDISTPGNYFREIHKTVPRKWWRYAAESLYYRLPETADSGKTERWLDTARVVLPDDNVRSFIQMIRGNRLVATGNYNEALLCLQESYNLAVQQKQFFRANDAKRYMARCLLLKGDYPQAIALLMEVLDFFSDKSDDLHQVRKYETRFELARACLISGDLNKALYWGRHTMDYLNNTKNPGQKVCAAEQITRIYLSMGKPDSALLYIKEAEEIRKQHNIKADSTNGHYLYGKTLTELRRYNEALPRLNLALAGNLEVKNRKKIADIMSSLADCYLGLSEADTALDYYQKALNITPDTSSMSYLYYKLSEIFQQRKKYPESLHHYQTGTRYSRIFFSAEKDRTIGRLESQAALEREANQVKLLTTQQKSREFKTTILFVVFLLSILTLGLLLDRQHRIKANLIRDKELLEAHQIIQKQELKIANISLERKTEEIASLQNLLDLKNQLISNLELQISSNPNQETMAQPLRMLTELDWREFRESFEKQFPNYILRLKNTFPAITNSEIRLFIFIKIGLENLQIANISGISTESVYKSRFRLRQKIGLDQSVSLESFIGSF